MVEDMSIFVATTRDDNGELVAFSGNRHRYNSRTIRAYSTEGKAFASLRNSGVVHDLPDGFEVVVVEYAPVKVSGSVEESRAEAREKAKLKEIRDEELRVERMRKADLKKLAELKEQYE